MIMHKDIHLTLFVYLSVMMSHHMVSGNGREMQNWITF